MGLLTALTRRRGESIAAQGVNAAGESFPNPYGEPDYFADALAVWGKDVSFLDDPHFAAAYRLGMDSGHRMPAYGGGSDLHIEWRVLVACWAGWHARSLPGSFVECGVYTGIFPLAVCSYIDFNATGKDFFLFDTFEGIPEEQMSDSERAERVEENRQWYEDFYEIARRNFEPFPRAHLVRGTVPDSLGQVEIDAVSYLALDMNIAAPELAALEYFWDRLVPGAPVLLDDYGWTKYGLSKRGIDRFAESQGVKVLALPTGQGLLLKI